MSQESILGDSSMTVCLVVCGATNYIIGWRRTAPVVDFLEHWVFGARLNECAMSHNASIQKEK